MSENAKLSKEATALLANVPFGFNEVMRAWVCKVDAALFAPATEKGASVIVGSHHWFDPVIGRVVSEVITEPAPPATEKRSTDPDCGPYTHHWDFGFCHTCKKPGRDQGDAPATEKAVCPHCGQPTEESLDRPLFNDHLCQYPHQSAQPEPAAPEMPEAVSNALGRLSYHASCPHEPADMMEETLRFRDALESWWRTHSQPVTAKASYTKVESLLAALRWDLDRFPGQAILHYADQIDAAEREVRQQAAQGRKVELGKVREGK